MQNKDLNHEGTETLRDKILRVFVSVRFVRLSLWLAPILFLLFFFFQPLARIIILAFDSSAFTQKNFETILSVAGFTFYQAILSTLLTFVLGLPSAVLFSRFNFHGKSLLRVLTAVPFMLPTVVVASSFNALVGNHGIFSFLFPLSSDFATSKTFYFLLIVLANIFYNTTIVIRIVGNALSRLDPKLEAAARSLGADTFHVWKNVTLPLLRPSLLAAALLVFMFDFTSFGVILLLGGSNFSTLEVEIYLRVLKLPNLPLAALLSIVQLIFTLIFSILYTRTINQVTTPTAPRFSLANKPKTIQEKIFVTTLCILLSALFLLPLLSLPIRSFTRLEADRGQRVEVQYGFTTDYYKELFINRRGSLFYVPPIQAAATFLGYASGIVFLSLALGYHSAYALA